MRPFGFLANNWLTILAPMAAFFLCLAGLLYLRKRGLARVCAWSKGADWPAHDLVYKPIKLTSLALCVVLSAGVATAVSVAPNEGKTLVEHSLWTASVLITLFAASRVTGGLAAVIGDRLDLAGGTTVIRGVAATILAGASVLAIFAVWDVPAVPILLLVGTICVLTVVSLRDAAPNFFATLHLVGGKHIAEGDVVRLENGEQGRVTRIGWINTHLQTPVGDDLVIPNSHLAKQRLTRIGQSCASRLAAILTARELEIARLLAKGASNREIAGALSIAENTARVHTKTILKKLGLRSRHQLVSLPAIIETQADPAD